MKFLKIYLIAFAVLMVAAGSHAAPFTLAYDNYFQIDSLYLSITEGNVAFDKWQLVPTNWQAGYEQADLFAVSGPLIDPGERFRIKFNDRGSFTLEWAELLNGVIQAAGSLYLVNGNIVGISNDFTSTIPTPATGTFWLLGSGLICFICIRKRLANCDTRSGWIKN